MFEITLKATAIKMIPEYYGLYSAEEIDSIFLQGATTNGLYKKEIVYDYLKRYPKSIQVAIYPYPYLVPVLSEQNNKYVRSEPNDTPSDNLLQLPHVL
ncbi:MAG: DUF3892 domain-containing protein [Christensenella sp.]